jgi:hypothetical protein
VGDGRAANARSYGTGKNSCGGEKGGVTLGCCVARMTMGGSHILSDLFQNCILLWDLFQISELHLLWDGGSRPECPIPLAMASLGRIPSHSCKLYFLINTSPSIKKPLILHVYAALISLLILLPAAYPTLFISPSNTSKRPTPPLVKAQTPPPEGLKP